MKMKKMLAILAALSVLGTTGLTVGAEDTATTTESATEAITTTETEAETTAAETTAETDVTEETAATEENQVVGKIGETAEFTFNGIKFQAVEVDPEDFDSSDPLFQSGCVGLIINRIEEDGSVTATNLTKIALFMKGDGGGSGSDTPVYLKPVLDFISIDGDILTIDAYGGNQSYQYVDGQFVPAGTAPTTTTTTAAETTPTTTTTTTEATNAIVDQKTETMIVQGKPYTLRFVLFKSTYSYGYCISIYVDGKLVISDQPVGYFEYNPTSVSSYAGVSRDSVSEVTVTDWGESTTTPTTTSFHYQYDPSQGVFVAVVRSDEDSETTSTKEALYNKFVAAYGKPTYTNYGDFDQDGELDAYFVYYDSTGVNTYFVTKDGITLVDKNTGDSMWSSDFAYFTCNGYRFRANLHTRIPVAYATGYITIERIEADGSLTKVNFNETVLQDSFAVDHNPNYTADLREDLANKVSSYFSCNGDKITVTHYLYENGRDVGSNSYVYDEATNSFVKAGNTTPDDDNNQQKPLEIHLGDTMTVTGTLHYELETAYENNHKQVVLKLDKPITVTYMDEMENGFGSVKAGMTEVVDSVQISLDDKLPEGTHLTVTGNVMYGHTGHHIRHIVLNNCTYRLDGKTDDGKTDNGSASNAPATKNTSGTPKTGDITTVPAVAVGLTLTAAGVVAFISKRKK